MQKKSPVRLTHYRNFLIAILSLTAVTTVALAEPLFKSDVVFPPKGFGRPHGASMVELPNGDILTTWFSSKVETSKDAEIFGSVWNKKSGKWGAPYTIIDSDYSKSVGNTALFKDDDGLIWIFFASVFIGGWSGAMVDYVQSADDGATWSEGKRLVWWPGNLPRNAPVKIGDHTMLVPLFIDFWYEANLVGSYTAKIKYKDGKILSNTYASLDDVDAIQPTVTKLPDGKILLLARDKTDVAIRRSYSNDAGKSWSKVTKTELPNPGAAICSLYIEELSAVLVVYNHSNEGRNPLSLAVSMDNGKSFKRVFDLAYKKDDGEASFSYPAAIRTKDGMIHLIWSHDKRATLKHVWFNTEWLREKMSHAK